MDDWTEFWGKYRTIILQVIVALLAGGLASLLGGDTASLYERLVSPPSAPPGWVFPVVWTVLYVLMGVTAGLVAGSRDIHRDKALTRYYIQLSVNVLWPMLFFRFRLMTVAAVWLALLVVAVYVTRQWFRRISAPAGRLLIPYLLWCLFALYLNIGFVVLN